MLCADYIVGNAGEHNYRDDIVLLGLQILGIYYTSGLLRELFNSAPCYDNAKHCTADGVPLKGFKRVICQHGEVFEMSYDEWILLAKMLASTNGWPKDHELAELSNTERHFLQPLYSATV